MLTINNITCFAKIKHAFYTGLNDIKKKIRIIIDTYIWISFLLTKSLKDIDKLIFNG